MFAGGCVRDRLLKVSPKDFDIATSAKPEQMSDFFTKYGYRVVPTGVEHGTITVVSSSGSVEITSLRRDVKTDGRHAVVDFEGATFETDAARRDFTINALFEDATGKIHDFHKGLEDLQSGVVRFVGEPEQRIREDYLRILRFFRFWARFGFKADPRALQAITTEASGLKIISQERITSELWGILTAPNSCESLLTMAHTGVLALTLPEAIALGQRHRIILMDAESTLISHRPWIVFGVLLGLLDHKSWEKNSLQSFCRRLRFSDKQSKLLQDLLLGWQALGNLPRETASALEFSAQIEREGSEFLLVDFFAPIWQFFARHSRDQAKQSCIGWLVSTDIAFGDRRKTPLPLTGHDVMNALPGLAGAQIGDMIAKARHAYYNGDWRTKAEGLEFISKILGQTPLK